MEVRRVPFRSILPIPISKPTVGTGLGLASGVLYQMDAQSTPSYTGIGGLATSNGTWGAGALQYFSLDEDHYRLSFGLGYASVKYAFYGSGHAAGDRGASIPLTQDAFFTNSSADGRVPEGLALGPPYRRRRAWPQTD